MASALAAVTAYGQKFDEIYGRNYDEIIAQQQQIIADANAEIARLKARIAANGEKGEVVNPNSLFGGCANDDLRKEIMFQESIIADANRKIENARRMQNRSDVDIRLKKRNSYDARQKQSQQRQRRYNATQMARQKAAAAKRREAQRRRNEQDRQRRAAAGAQAVRDFDSQNQAGLQNKLSLTQRANENLYHQAANSGFYDRQERLRNGATKRPAAPQQYSSPSVNAAIQDAPKSQVELLIIPLNTDF